MKHKQQSERLRECIAQEAAKIMHEQNLRDYQQAKQKACERLGILGKQSLPGNDEIQRALTAYIDLFKSDTQPELLKRLRASAIDAMNFLSVFEPRLVGSVLHGTADDCAPVQLHVFADPPELILQFLFEHSIPHQLSNKRIQYCNSRVENITACEFIADGVSIELILFNEVGLREAPRSPINGKVMQRMCLREVEDILNKGD